MRYVEGDEPEEPIDDYEQEEPDYYEERYPCGCCSCCGCLCYCENCNEYMMVCDCGGEAPF